jgi:acyl-CoA synthetase (AMP-forming)/AMP-acid ligase II
MKIYPSEIERVLMTLPGVRECAVVRGAHSKWGATPIAYVVQAEGASLSEIDVISWCRQHLASYKKPSRVLFVADLPKNASGKVSRHLLQQTANS